MSQVKLWGWTGTGEAWGRVLVDASGHLQTDVLSSALPTGAATSAKQDTIIGHVDGIEGLLAAGLPSALDTDTLKAGVYSGGAAIDSQDMSAEMPLASLGMVVAAVPYLRSDNGTARFRHQYAAYRVTDAETGVKIPAGGVMGYNGSTWDRLRVGAPSDTYTNPSYALETLAVCMGYNGSTLSRLKVEDSTNPNLRVRLYRGATAVTGAAMTWDRTTFASTEALHTQTQLILTDTSTGGYPLGSQTFAAAGNRGWTVAAVAPFGWDGSQNRQIRVAAPTDTYANPAYAQEAMALTMGWDSGNSYWERVKVSAAGSLMVNQEVSEATTSGPIQTSQLLHNGHNHVYAITINKANAAAEVVQIIDGEDDTGDVKWEVRLPGLQPYPKNFWPWLKVVNGLYIKIDGSPYSIVVEYGAEEP